MAKKLTLHDVVDKIDDLASAVQGLASHMDEKFAEQDAKFATKEDLRGFCTKDDLQSGLSALESRITTEIDRFVVLHQTLDVELVSLRRRCERIENHVGMG
jgi:hypothetical protein